MLYKKWEYNTEFVNLSNKLYFLANKIEEIKQKKTAA
jgi:hypothetical protein